MAKKNPADKPSSEPCDAVEKALAVIDSLTECELRELFLVLRHIPANELAGFLVVPQSFLEAYQQQLTLVTEEVLPRLCGAIKELLPELVLYSNRCWRIQSKPRHPERDAEILERKARGQTAGQIARRLGMTRDAVRQVIRRKRPKK